MTRRSVTYITLQYRDGGRVIVTASGHFDPTVQPFKGWIEYLRDNGIVVIDIRQDGVEAGTSVS